MILMHGAYLLACWVDGHKITSRGVYFVVCDQTIRHGACNDLTALERKLLPTRSHALVAELLESVTKPAESFHATFDIAAALR